MVEDNCIFVGGKPFMNYVTGIVMQFTTKNAKEVIIKARGKFISRAVDIAEVTTKRFLEDQVKVEPFAVHVWSCRARRDAEFSVDQLRGSLATHNQDLLSP